MTSTKLLSEFQSSCKDAFGFLESDHGLKLVEAKQYGREFSVAYESTARKVVITFEPLTLPWVVLERKEGKRWKREGLQRLCSRVCPHDSDIPAQSGREENDLYDKPGARLDPYEVLGDGETANGVAGSLLDLRGERSIWLELALSLVDAPPV